MANESDSVVGPDDYGFISISKGLLASSGYVSPKTGEFIPWGNNGKALYAVLVDRHKFYVVKNGNSHYESQEALGELTGLSRQTVAYILKGFINNGVIDVTVPSREEDGNKTYIYNSVNTNLTLWWGSAKSPRSKMKDKYSKVDRHNAVKKQPTKVDSQSAQYVDDVDMPPWEKTTPDIPEPVTRQHIQPEHVNPDEIDYPF